MKDRRYDARSWYKRKFDDIDAELMRLSIACRADLLAPGAIERVIRDDATVCGTTNPRAFAKLRELLMMHYATRKRAVEALGETETQAVIAEVVARLRARAGRAPRPS
jgi:hypothetical protein